MHFFISRKIDNRNLLELPKVDLGVINGSLKTCNVKLSPVSPEKLKDVFFSNAVNKSVDSFKYLF